MSRIVALALAACFASVARAEEPGFGTPLVALTSTRDTDFDEHHAFVVYALYPDGHVLFSKEDLPYNHAYSVGLLSRSQVKALLETLPLARVGSIHPSSPHGFDGATECVLVWSHGQRARECYWGGLADDPHAYPQNFVTQPPPPELAKIWNALVHAEPTTVTEWVPSTLEMAVFKPHGRCDVVRWPDGWARPDLARGRPPIVGAVSMPAAAWPIAHQLTTPRSSCKPQLELDGVLYELRALRGQPSLP